MSQTSKLISFDDLHQIRTVQKCQLGDLSLINDDCIHHTFTFLSNRDVFNCSSVSKYTLFKEQIRIRKNSFDTHRREKVKQYLRQRHAKYQFANRGFKNGQCIVARCPSERGILHIDEPQKEHTSEYNSNPTYFIPYCSLHWNFILLKYFS